MAYDEGLAQRLRENLEDHRGLSEKKMFGGVGFMLNGNMACGVIKDDLVVRVGPEGHEDALSQPHARKFDFTGRPMKGWVMVSAGGYEADEDLTAWVGRGTAYAESLPEK
jgi:hypothetical protein